MDENWELMRFLLLQFKNGKIAELGGLYQDEWFKENIATRKLIHVFDGEKAKEIIFRHIRMMLERNFVGGVRLDRNDFGSPLFHFDYPYITSYGYDFLEALRRDGMFQRIIDAAGKHGIELTIGAIQAIYGQILRMVGMEA